MAWDLDSNEALTYLVALAFAALGVLLWRAQRQRSQNRWFIALLALEFALAAASPTISVTTDLDTAYWAAFVFIVVLVFTVPVYLGFLSTLGGPVGRFLRKPIVRLLPWGIPTLGLTALLLSPGLMIASPDPTARDVWATVGGPLLLLFQICGLLMWILGLVVVIAYWRSSPVGTAMRRQSRIFAFAFGIHDCGMLLAIGLLVSGGAASGAGWAVTYYGLPLVKLVLLTLLTYGILRFQLFDIDLKIKWTIGRGTAVALLAATFFLITETVEFFLPGEGLVANLGGAAIVTVLARPAWRLGNRFANTVLPGIVETEEFRNRRRVEVYRASFESVAADGIITDRERRILETMRTKLGIAREEAIRIETELLRGGGNTIATGNAPPTTG